MIIKTLEFKKKPQNKFPILNLIKMIEKDKIKKKEKKNIIQIVIKINNRIKKLNLKILNRMRELEIHLMRKLIIKERWEISVEIKIDLLIKNLNNNNSDKKIKILKKIKQNLINNRIIKNYKEY